MKKRRRNSGRRHAHTASLCAAAALSMALILAPFSYTTFQKNEAVAIELFGFSVGPDIVFDPTNLVQTTATAVSSASLQLKELTLDGAANALMKQAVRQMTTSIVRWINSGFEGSPAFVTDLDGFLLDIADQAAGKFFADNSLEGLCSPFQFSVSAALELQYRQPAGERYACTLSSALTNAMDSVGNISGSMNSWGNWFDITTKPQNNQYGAYMLAQQDLYARVSGAQETEKTLLDYGDGFLSLKTCVEVNGQKQCSVASPGSVIGDVFSKALGAGQDTLISADEINEIVSALFAQLGQQALTGAGGIRGLSGGSGGSSYLDRVDGGADDFGLTNSSLNPIDDALENEYEAESIYRAILALLDETEADATSDGCTPPLSTGLEDRRSKAQQSAAQNASIIAELEFLATQYDQAASVNAQNSLYQQYLDLSNAGQLHTQFDLLTLEFDYDETAIEAEQFLDDCD